MSSNTIELQNTVNQITNILHEWFDKINDQTLIGRIDASLHWDADGRDKEIASRAKSLSAEYNYCEEFVKKQAAKTNINVLLPLFAFDNNLNPTKCTTVKYNMCVIINPSDEFKSIESPDKYIGWKETDSNPTHPVVSMILDKIAPSSNDPADDRDHFVEHNKLYHQSSAQLLDDEKIITGAQIFGNQQKMIPFTVISRKV